MQLTKYTHKKGATPCCPEHFTASRPASVALFLLSSWLDKVYQLQRICLIKLTDLLSAVLYRSTFTYPDKRMLISLSDIALATFNLQEPCVLYIGRPRSATIQMLHFIYFFNKYKY
jgi:hypothetical protein